MKKSKKLLAKVPSWLPKLALTLMGEADVARGMFGSGATAKQWVIESLLLAAKLHNIPLLPEKMEQKLERILIEAVVDVLFSLHFRGNARRREAKARRAQGEQDRVLAVLHAAARVKDSK